MVQRVAEARVSVDGEVVGEIGTGLCVLLGVATGDSSATALTMAKRLYGLRLLADDAGVMNRSVGDVGGGMLVISQFTLLGDTSRGRRPSWSGAAPAAEAEPLVEEVVAELGRMGATVATGRFGAHMVVEIVNDGPVTVVVEV
ncbi:MAG: D-aminoacyl-tRNA deacylase [Actinomycetota bacterium]|nr:D-aminoacyl-tRNA deacylase [Actinomycetota bacterium]